MEDLYCNDQTAIICSECSRNAKEETVNFDDDMTFGEWLENANRLFDEIISKKFAIITEARMLSSGTIAGLIDNSNYDAIEEAQQKFIVWLTQQENLFENWHLAWEAFCLEA